MFSHNVHVHTFQTLYCLSYLTSVFIISGPYIFFSCGVSLISQQNSCEMYSDHLFSFFSMNISHVFGLMEPLGMRLAPGHLFNELVCSLVAI